jgi:dipeptidyl aminopeptidase/acylaminoacyl peptidase
MSPDGRHAAIIDAFNLSIRDVASHHATPITTDGAEDFYYGSPPQLCCGERTWGLPPKDIDGVWSADSQYFLTYQVDQRQVQRNFLISTGGLRGKSLSYPFPQPGDPQVPVLHPVVIDTLSGALVHITDVATIGFFNGARSQYFDVQWAENSKSFYILKTLRGSKRAELYQCDPKTGRSELIFSEDTDAFPDLPDHVQAKWRVSRDGRTLLWYSNRGGWGQLYRVELPAREPSAVLTPPGSEVESIEGFDESHGWVYFTAQGGERDVYPYARQLYRVQLDGSQLTRLTPESVNHEIFMSPTGRYFVDIAGLHDRPNTTLLKRSDGRQVRVLERTDATRLFAAGWRAPELIEAPSADGRFTLYGLLYKPSTVEAGRRYPLLDLIYPGPHNGPTRVRGFTTDPSNNPQAFAELGFMVLALTASGTDGRGRAFQEAWYGDMGNLGLADHRSVIERLAAQCSCIDLGRVGIMGTSAGGDAAARAMFVYPDFFKTGVSASGSYDYRMAMAGWGETFQGLLVRRPDGSDNYPIPTYALAKNLQGRLLVSYGTLDDNVNPAVALNLIAALEQADKDFDLIVVPGQGHWPQENPNYMRRVWDYLVENLAGQKPPVNYHIAPKPGDDDSEAP